MKNKLLLAFLLTYTLLHAQERRYDKAFFVNSPMAGSYYYSSAGYSGKSWIKNVRQKLPVSTGQYFTPGNALELHYVSATDGNWQAALQYRELRGVDNFTDATQLVFWLYIATPQTGKTGLPQIAVVQNEKDSSSFLALGDFVASAQAGKWRAVKIPLAELSADARAIQQIIFRQAGNDGQEHKIYIDQVELLPADAIAKVLPVPVIVQAKAYEKHVDIAWKPVVQNGAKYVKLYRSGNGKIFYPVAVQPTYFNSYADYTDTTGKKFFYRISLLDENYHESALSNMVSASTHPMSDSALLSMVQEANFRYYWDGAEPNSGLALEDIPGRSNMIAAGASGFGMMALIAGAERKFITREQLINRFDRITLFLEKAEKFHGAFPHFIDGNTGKVVPFFGDNDNGGDLVETSFLMQGLLVARQYFNRNTKAEATIRQRINKVWNGVEWDWYRKEKDSKYLFWHWSPDKEWIINHNLIGWNETLITYFLAIASSTHGVPASMYYTGWASQEEKAQQYRSAWGQTEDGSHYTNGNTYFGIPLKVGVSNGGPLFFVHYSFMGLNPHTFSDAYTNYFGNNKNIALINYRYCVANPQNHNGYGPEAWGLTASDGPHNYAADEPVPHADKGKLTATGALASFPYTPAESMVALKNYYRNYGKFLWGNYGFKDAFSLDNNWCSEIFMGLNQAPVTVMIENYRSGLVWNLFMSAPEVQEALRKLANEKPVSKQ
ncbi:glucoamylase family protein [Foetidibacter luteolus]|uniref:glucoamylase family protein n=1 Tax=Foetidibacter luteolus TaxID=2608880 RepID=UPI00129AD72B|nr:glucoamylase family protein [Foetidibacter luteolus]